MNLSLPRSSYLTIYKSFVRPHLDYGDVIYDQPNNSSLSDKIESVQYNAVLAITGAIRGTSKDPFRGHIVTLVVLKLCAAGLNFSETPFYRLL